jgi:hypothetical protein
LFIRLVIFFLNIFFVIFNAEFFFIFFGFKVKLDI